MQLPFSVVVVLFVTCCAQEEHLEPNHGLESKHSVVKGDVSEKDNEFILKSVTSKEEHGPDDSELIHKSMDMDREHHLYEPEVKEKVYQSDMKEHEYMKEEVPLEKGYEIKKELAMSETDLMELLMKIKELSAYKGLEGTSKEKVHLSKDPVLMEKSKGMFGDIVEEDKFSDKDVSLAESLYHMKIAGDIETYPHIKLEALNADMKKGDEKLHLEKVSTVLKASADEAYLKKVDEVGKSLLKEETYPHLKGDDIAGYLKKVAEEEKDLFYEPKISHSEIALKGAEEKSLEAWKASHKDLFPAEGRFLLGEKMKKEGVHHAEGSITHGLSDEMVKKLKASSGLGKELSKEHDELLLHLSKELHKEAGLDEEEMKKHIEKTLDFGAKEKNHGTEYLFEKGVGTEKIHGINTKIGAGMEKSLHEIIAEEALKSKGAHAYDESYGFEMDKAKFGGKLPFESGVNYPKSHKIPDHFAAESEKVLKVHEDELLKKEKIYETDAFLHKAHEDELLKKEKAYGTDPFLHKAHEEELLKKEKAYGADSFLHKAHEEELLKKEKAYGADSFLHKAHEEELLKKEKAYGGDSFLHKAHEEELLKKEKAYGGDSFLHKAHEEELLKKEKAYGADSFLHKAHEEELLKKEKAYGADSFLHKAHEEELLKKEKAYGADSFLHKAHEEELLKKEKAYGADSFFPKAQEEELLKKQKAYGADSFLYKDHEDELLKKEIIYGTDPHKVIGEELIKKEIAYGSDSFFNKNKEVLETDDHHLLHTLKGEESGIFHGVSTDKHLVGAKDEIGAEKSHKTIHDLKAKFFELLRRVLHIRKCHLVTMRPGELLSIVNCISRSKDPLLCEKFAMCEKKMPNRVIAALEKCQKEIIPGQVMKCNRYAPLYPTAEIPLKIFQCIATNVGELKPEEKKYMIDFEECARVIKAEGCSRFKFFPRPL